MPAKKDVPRSTSAIQKAAAPKAAAGPSATQTGGGRPSRRSKTAAMAFIKEEIRLYPSDDSSDGGAFEAGGNSSESDLSDDFLSEEGEVA